MKTPKQMPTYRAFTTVKRADDQRDFWMPVGAAFAHRDNKGFSVVLQSVPLNGRVILRPIDEKAPEQISR